MDTIREPYILDLAHRGCIQGVTILQKPDSRTKEKATATQQGDAVPLCRYFGGLRYALPPTRRWGQARPLPRDYSYGMRENPGRHDGQAAVCPQPGASSEDIDGLDEDCFQCNVWVPVGSRPDGGWPVFFFIHGGFLQVGTPNLDNYAALLGETDFKCVIVTPAYRLSVLGFLTSKELQREAASHGESSGNQGFWDQRLALEWTHENIHLFGGNASNITVAGYSAGAYSVFHQLAHDLYLPDDKSIIRQAVMWSNGPGIQPKSVSNAQDQFDDLLSALDVPQTLSPTEKLARLQSLPAHTLIEAGMRIKQHQFRPWSDSAFISTNLFRDIDNGTFARRLAARNIRLMNGECRDEHFVYGTWHPPKEDSLSALRERIEADYPPEACDALVKLYYPSGQLPADCWDWLDAFGRLYADVQVHMLERGFLNALARGGAGHLLYRYRIEYRVKCVDDYLPPAWGVTHGSDKAMWFWGDGAVLEEVEKQIVRSALLDHLVRFVRGESEVGWNTRNVKQARRLRPDGKVDIWDDTMWERGQRVWNALQEVGSTQPSAKL
ncbi:hypothetical protein VTN77DRAFT_5082 [Rasamsonia byssochlamydoides]|uniref:uncharacterized protein n=1 Tax=Rasamsonia byssochlamydoides TaxID=89139 RepID=UPI0037434AC1